MMTTTTVKQLLRSMYWREAVTPSEPESQLKEEKDKLIERIKQLAKADSYSVGEQSNG